MIDLYSMFRTADEDGECSAEIEPGVHVEQLRLVVETAGYLFKTHGRIFSVLKTDGRAFSVLKNKRHPIQYAKTGTV